jgi:HIV-1 Vpr-binding protein
LSVKLVGQTMTVSQPVETCLQDEEELYDAIVDQWVSARSATLEQQVAGLRLLLACLDCWLFQYPLTEEALVEKLGHWAVGGLDKAAVLGDEPPATLQALQEEARQTYAMGECTAGALAITWI